MSSPKLHAAASVTPPVSGEVYARASIATAERIEIPASWRGNYVTFQAEGEDIWVVFGDDTVVASATDTSSLASEALTADVNTTWHIPAGQEKDFDLRNIGAGVTHFSHIAAGTTGYLRMRESSSTQE